MVNLRYNIHDKTVQLCELFKETLRFGKIPRAHGRFGHQFLLPVQEDLVSEIADIVMSIVQPLGCAVRATAVMTALPFGE
jgi:hypothetical protein